MILKNSTPVIVDSVLKMIKRAGTRNPEEICEAYHIKIREINMAQRIKAYYYYQSRMGTRKADFLKEDLGAYESPHFDQGL